MINTLTPLILFGHLVKQQKEVKSNVSDFWKTKLECKVLLGLGAINLQAFNNQHCLDAAFYSLSGSSLSKISALLGELQDSGIIVAVLCVGCYWNTERVAPSRLDSTFSYFSFVADNCSYKLGLLLLSLEYTGPWQPNGPSSVFVKFLRCMCLMHFTRWCFL